MEGRYAANRREALAFKRELEQIKKKAAVDRKIHQLATEDAVLLHVTDSSSSKKRSQSVCASTVPGGKKGIRSIKSQDDATKLFLVTTQVPKSPKEPKPRPSHSKLNSQQGGDEMQRKTYVKKEASNKQFAITGACNTATPVQLAERPIPPARKPLNLPTASAKEVEESSSKVGSLPQHLKSRPTTRTSMQTSGEMSKSSFQQYILATADYMHASSEPFSITSGSPLSVHVQSQVPGKQMPLRVQSLPNFSTYTSGTLFDDRQTGGYSEQQDYEDLDAYGSETALDFGTKKQNRALKLEVDLRVATSLTSTDTPGDSAPTELVRPEQSDKPASSVEVPSVNVIQSLSPFQSYPSYPAAPVQQKDEGITVVHSDGIYWTSREPFTTIPCVDSSSLAVSDTASQSSSTLTLKDDAVHPQAYSESLNDEQSTADRSLLYEQDDSLMSSDNRGAYIGSSSDISARIDSSQPDRLLKIQTNQFPSFTSGEESINIFSSGSPGHLMHSTDTATPAGDKPSTLATDVGSGVTPVSQLSHDIISLRHEILNIPAPKETSVSAPTILNITDNTGTSDKYISSENSLNLPSDDESHSGGHEITPVLTMQTEYGEGEIQLEDTLTPDVQHKPSITTDSAGVMGLTQAPESSLSIEQKDSGALSATSYQPTDIEQSSRDVTISEVVKQSSDEKVADIQDDLQLTANSNLTDSKEMISEVVPLVLVDSGSRLEGESQAMVKSESQTKALHGTLSTEKVMEKLLNNQTDDLPPQSLAEFLAYTDKPVTLADVMNVRGESLIPPAPQPSEEQLFVDSEELDAGGLQDDRPTTPGLLTGAASDMPRSVSVGKKRVVFLSDWPQEKLNTEQDLAIKQLVEPSSRNSIHHFCVVPESPQLPHRLQILSCKTHAKPQPKNTLDQKISAPPATPVVGDETVKQTDQTAVTSSTSPKKLTEPVDAIDESSTSMLVEGKSLTIISDSSSLLWKPAPAKLSLFPSTIKSHLFPHYRGLSTARSAGQGRVTIKLPPEADTHLHSAKKTGKTGPANLAFRSLIDFSKYSARDVQKLLPFPGSSGDTAGSSSSSSSGSSSSSSSSSSLSGMKYTIEITDDEDQRSVRRSVAGSDDRGLQVDEATVSDGDTASLQEDMQYEQEFMNIRMGMPRRSTLPDVEELEAVSKDMQRQISRLQQQRQEDECTTVSSAISDGSSTKRYCASMPNMFHVEVKEDNALDYDDFTNTMAELERQRKHLAAHHGHDEQAADSDVECLSGTTDMESVFLRDERQQRQRRFRPAHTRPGRSGRQKAVKKRTKSALARAREAKKLLSQPARNLKRSASFPLFKGNTSSIEVQPPSTDYRKSKRLSDPVYHDFTSLAQSHNQRLTTEKECYKWADQLWDEWFEEAYAESKAELEMLQPNSSISFFGSSKSKLLLDKDESRTKEVDEGPKIYELENIEKTIFDDEATINEMKGKVDRLSSDIKKATTAETRAIHFCRRGALLRKLGRFSDAKDDLDKAIALVPRLVDAHWHRHCLFIIQNDPTSAMVELDTILGLNRRHTKAYRSKAMLLKDTGDIKEALFCLSQAVILDRKNKTLYNQRAVLYEQKGAIESAIEDYERMVEIDPNDSSAILKMGMHHFNKKMWSAASQNFTLLVERDASNTTARIHRAQAQWKLGNYVQALQDLSAAIHLDPNNATAYYHRACLLRVRHPHKALQDYSTSLLLDSSVNNMMAFLHRGILYTSINCYIDAIPDFEAAIKLDSTVACFHVCLGLTYLLHSKQYQRAVTCFTASIQADPTYVRAYVCRAEAYQQMNKLKKALLDYVRASHIQPDEGSYLLYKGYLLLLMNKLDLAHAHISTAAKMGACLGQETAHKASLDSFLGNHDEAIRELEVAVRSKPSPQMFMLLGRTCQNAGDHTQAIDAFDRAIEAIEMRSHGSSPLKPSLLSQIHFLCGTSHTELGHYPTAIEHLNEALHHVPTNAAAYYQRGIAKLKSGNNKGILDLNRALSINPKMYEVFLTRACYYSANGRYTKAILNCNQAIHLQPQSVRAYLYRGSMKYYTNQFKSAIEDLTTAANLDRQCSLVYFNRALCQQALGNTEKAIADYSTVLLIKEEPTYIYEVLINRGLLYLTMEEYGSALMDMIDAGKLRPMNSSIFQAIGLCYHRLGELQLSIEAYDQAILLDSFFIEAYIGRGNVHMDYLTPGRIVMSKVDYCKALHFDPCCLPARVNLAHTLQMEEKYQRSWNHFSCALMVDPRYVPALEGRAIVNLQMGNLFGSFLDITNAIKVSPSAELYTNRGVIHQFMGRGVDAMLDYEMALKLNGHYGLAYFNMGNVYFHHRQFQQAVVAYTKALKISPDDDSYLLNRAITKSMLKDYDGALDDFNTSIEINPNVAHAYFNRGNLYKSYEKYDLAEEDYKTALSLNPGDQVCIKYCADVLGKQGKTEEALKYFETQLDHK